VKSGSLFETLGPPTDKNVQKCQKCENSHHSPLFGSLRRVGRNEYFCSEKVEAFLAVVQRSVEALRGADAFLVVEQ